MNEVGHTSDQIGRLDIQLLRSLLAIANSPTLSKAAKVLNIPQPTMSLQMKRLEERAGCELFKPGRRGKPMRLSQEGEILVEHATSILRAHEDAVLSLGAGIKISGSVRIGIPELMSEALIGQSLTRFRNVFRNVNLEVRVGNAARIKQMQHDNEVDLRICVDDTNQVNGDLLFTEKMCWVGSTKDTHMGADGSYPVAMLSEGEPFRDVVINKLNATGIPWHESYTSDSMIKLRNAAAAGIGYTAIPASMVTREVKMIDDAHILPTFIKSSYAMYRSDNVRNDANLNIIADTMLEFLRNSVAPVPLLN